MVTGVSSVDSWIDKVLSAIEQALNVSGSDGISVRRGPQGMQIGLNVGPTSTLATVKSGGIPKLSGGVPGRGNVTIQSFDGVNAPVGIYDDQAFNMGNTDIAAGSLVALSRVGRYWFAFVVPCPPEEA
ncbi:hypothetical protein [Singulisphaera sp. PoT]|uniref:hypothetical protein n=1 Tax=Singulisphaera sp. PoT TaxID=3411797 RepID=UPI003BF5AAB0